MVAGSDRFWLLELRVSRTFLDQLRPLLCRPWIPSSARDIDGGPRRFTEVVLDEQSLPLASLKLVFHKLVRAVVF